MAKAKALPKVSIIDRRLENPFGTGSVPITLKTAGLWEVRWAYSKLRAGRIHDMTKKLGWVFVEPSELDGSPEEYGFVSKENRLVRGEHGEEVLMKMPLEDFKKIQMAKDEANLKQLGKKQMRDAVAQAAGEKHGSEAGDSVFNAFAHGDIKDSRGDMEEESA